MLALCTCQTVFGSFTRKLVILNAWGLMIPGELKLFESYEPRGCRQEGI